MASRDLMDRIFEIGDNGLSNELFVSSYQSFYKRHFDSGVRFKPAEYIYMFYGALCTLPLTTKITEHGSDGLVLSMYGNNILLIISYATSDGTLSLKPIHFNSNLHARKPILEEKVLDDIQQKLTLVKKRQIGKGEFDAALHSFNKVTLSRFAESVKVNFDKVPINYYKIQMNSYSKFPESTLIQQGPRAQSTTMFVKQLQSESYNVVKYNSHAFTRQLMMQYKIVASASNQDMPLYLNNLYAFFLGAIEMNWAESHQLKVVPLIGELDNFISPLMIGYQAPVNSWKSRTTPFFIQLLTSGSELHEDGYDQDMYNQMAKTVPGFDQSEKVVAIGIEIEKLLSETTGHPIDLRHLELLPYTFLLDLDPMEDIVNLLLNNFRTETLPKIEYCIRTLNRKGKYGLHTYLYGQLMSKMGVEKFVHPSSGIQQGMTTFAFKGRNSEYAVILDIYQTDKKWNTNVKDIVPSKQGFRKLLHIIVQQKYLNDLNHFMSVNAEFLDHSDSDHRSVVTLTNWLPIPTVNPRDVLLNIEGHQEVFHHLPYFDALHTILASIDENLLKYHDKMSSQDIIPFFAGLFSGWDKIFYQDLFGIIKSDGSPLFISSLKTEVGNQEKLAEQALARMGNECLERDYVKNALRRVSNFVILTHTPESQNRFGIARLSTYERYRSSFESCLAPTSARMKRNSPTECLDNGIYDTEEISRNDLLSKESLLKDMKLRSHLKTIEKISRALMTAQMFKDMVGALMRGDYKTFAFNTAFLASGPLLESLSMKIVAKGVSLDSSLLGRSLLITAPFLGRLPVMGFVGFDLYEQVEAYRMGSTGAMVNIAGDSTILAIDFATASIEGAESLGIVSGLAEITGPIGFAIGTAIFVGMDVYSTAKTVSNIDAMVHLTGWQKFTTGFFSFLHVSPMKAVRQELFEKDAMDASIENAARFFKDHPFVKYYIFPSYQENGDFVVDNIIDLTTKVTRMAHTWPKDVADTRLICAGNNNLRVDKTSKLLLNCSNSFGYESASSANDLVVIFMSDGDDEVRTFNDKSTTFLIGNGHKYVVGSTEDDIFILTGNATSGHFDGRWGKNLLNLANYASNLLIHVDLPNNQLINSDHIVNIVNINSVVGRQHDQDIITCDCDTQSVDTQGGGATNPDIVMLKNNCFYDIVIRINGTMRIKNEAEKSKFQYLIQGDHQAVISSVCSSDMSQKFMFEQKIEDVNGLQVINLDNASLCHNLTIQSEFNTLKLGNIHNGAVYIFEDSEMRINNGTVSINSVSNGTVTNIYEKYAVLSKKLNAVINVFAAKENISMLFGNGKAIHPTNSDSHINILPNDPYHITYLVGGVNQNVFRISTPQLYNTTVCKLESVPPVTIVDYATSDYVNVIDIYEIILLVQDQVYGYVGVRAEIQNLDVLIKVYGGCSDGRMFNIVNLTLDRALEDENYKKIVINMRRPMTIMLNKKSVILVPADYRIQNETYTVIHRGLIEPFTTVVSPRTLGRYDIVRYNDNDLILTNLKFIDNEGEATVIILEDALHFKVLLTLRFQFVDQVVRLPQQINRSDMRDFEDLLY